MPIKIIERSRSSTAALEATIALLSDRVEALQRALDSCVIKSDRAYYLADSIRDDVEKLVELNRKPKILELHKKPADLSWMSLPKKKYIPFNKAEDDI